LKDHHTQKEWNNAMNVLKLALLSLYYNTCNYVQEALESICQQTLEELEIIVIDDGSTDCSRAIVEEISNQGHTDSSL